MNRQQRYEPVPQLDEPIILDSIHSSSYNYNTALPTSVASSSHGGGPPSTISTPNSPPPSFHTHSSPGTPRPTHSQISQAQQFTELWGVAPSTVGGETINTSNDALATISGLKQRVEWLEESIGRLLLDHEEALKNPKTDPDEVLERTACCVTFTDASPDVEAALLSNRHNCCIAYSGSNREQKKKEERMVIMAILCGVFVVCSIVAVILAARSGKVNRAVNKAVDKAVEKAAKLME